MKASKLIEELTEITKENMNSVQLFKGLTNNELNFKVNENSWSILECIEHLNRYGNFYIPEIKKQIEKSTFEKSNHFKTGFLGNYFAKSMLPKEKLNKMKTFKSMNPINSSLKREVLDKFLHQQEQILELLTKSENTNLTKIKTVVSISKFIKIRLGDTFRVVIYHNLRHIIQAKKVRNEQKTAVNKVYKQ